MGIGLDFGLARAFFGIVLPLATFILVLLIWAKLNTIEQKLGR